MLLWTASTAVLETITAKAGGNAVDLDRRSSLALDVIEAVRPHVDCWLLAYLAASAFANRDFTEVTDGEVRLTHPLNSQLAHIAALWRKVCEPVANWLARSFGGSTGFGAVLAENRKVRVTQMTPSMLLAQDRGANPLTLLPAFSGPTRSRLPMPLQGALKDNPVPLACWECGKALVGKRRRFCSNGCARAYPTDQLGAGRRPGLAQAEGFTGCVAGVS
jgi:hypothetical protein